MLSEPWRHISGTGRPTVLAQGYHCDLPKPRSTGIVEGWYRFQVRGSGPVERMGRTKKVLTMTGEKRKFIKRVRAS